MVFLALTSCERVLSHCFPAFGDYILRCYVDAGRLDMHYYLSCLLGICIMFHMVLGVVVLDLMEMI